MAAQAHVRTRMVAAEKTAVVFGRLFDDRRSVRARLWNIDSYLRAERGLGLDVSPLVDRNARVCFHVGHNDGLSFPFGCPGSEDAVKEEVCTVSVVSVGKADGTVGWRG